MDHHHIVPIDGISPWTNRYVLISMVPYVGICQYIRVFKNKVQPFLGYLVLSLFMFQHRRSSGRRGDLGGGGERAGFCFVSILI